MAISSPAAGAAAADRAASLAEVRRCSPAWPAPAVVTRPATVPSFAFPFCFFGLLLCDLLYESRILLDPRGKLASIVERFVLGASRSNQSDPPWVSYSRLRFTPTNKSTTRHTKIHARKIHRPLPLFIFIRKKFNLLPSNTVKSLNNSLNYNLIQFTS